MQVEQIKSNSTINLGFSTTFYQRLQLIATHFVEPLDKELLIESYRKMRENVELTEQETDLETILILIRSLETAAREQGFVETVTVPDQDLNT